MSYHLLRRLCGLVAVVVLGACSSPGHHYTVLDLKFQAAATTTPAQPDPVQPVVVDFTIFNTFDQPVTGVFWEAFADGTPGQPTTGTLIASGTVDLAAYAMAPETFTIMPPTPGTHTYTIVIDPNDAVPVVDRSQTVSTFSLNFAWFNLSFAAAPTVTPPNPTTSDAINIDFGILNTDTSMTATPATNVDWQVLEGTNIVSQGSVASVAPGATAPVVATISATTVGTHTYVVMIDPANTIPESNKTDNSATVTVAVMPVSVN